MGFDSNDFMLHDRLELKYTGEEFMEYKKSAPAHGTLDGRYVTFYQYEFPRATRRSGKFLPKGTVRVREFLFSDGAHGQLVQFVLVDADQLGGANEQRALVDRMLEVSREDKRFSAGALTREELSGEIREYPAKKQICIERLLSEQEKIGLFASARRVRDSRKRQRRAWRWRLRFRGALFTATFFLGLVGGSLLQKYGLLDFTDNVFYQNYLLPAFDLARTLIEKIIR